MRNHSDVERLGVGLVDAAFTSLGWVFRHQLVGDDGIGALVEPTADGVASGRLLALQIKAGSSWFAEPTDEGWIYRGRDKDGYLRYWLGHTLPVLIILCDPDSEALYWQHVTAERITHSPGSWRIVIPRSQKINPEAVGTLAAIASATTSVRKMARMRLAGPDDARQAIRRDGPAAVLGVRECVWLDVKSGVYRLDRPAGQEELVKDVAAFANTRAGGLLLVGFSTRREHEEEILDELRPVPRAVVDLDRHRKIIASRVMPAMRDVAVEWIDCGGEAGVLVIDIPAQPRSSQPFVVPAPTGTEKVSKVAVGVPVRQGDSTVWLPTYEIQRLVGLGWAGTGDAVDSLTATLPADRGPQQVDRARYDIGGGAPGWKGVFQQAFNDLAEHGLWLGEPATEVYAVGPGVAQHFETLTELFGWVLCARPNQRPVAVAGEIWQALQDAGSGAPDGDALGALGYPVGDLATIRVVDRQTTAVELSGGRWGRGLLHRAATVDGQDWWWEPTSPPDTTMSAASRNWTATNTPPQLRARVLATLPWADTEDLAITWERRDAFVRDLPSSPFAGIPTMLSLRRGRAFQATEWRPGPHHNANDRLSYSSEFRTPQSQTMLSAEVMMTLPHAAMSSAVVACAEIRVEDFAAWAAALAPGVDEAPRVDLRWSIDDVFEFFVAAWQIATDMLPPLAMNEPTRQRRWSAVPRIELWIGADQRHDGARSLLLQDVVDLTAFGNSDRRDQITEMMIAVSALPGLTADVRRRVARQAMVEMAHRFGFLSVTETSF